MSPLKIKMLLQLYCAARPFDDMPLREVHAPSMVSAFHEFKSQGLLAPGVSHASVVSEPIPRLGSIRAGRLSDRGLALVQRLCDVEPGPALDPDCERGVHTWSGERGRLPPDTPCALCGELYGDPS